MTILTKTQNKNITPVRVNAYEKILYIEINKYNYGVAFFEMPIFLVQLKLAKYFVLFVNKLAF